MCVGCRGRATTTELLRVVVIRGPQASSGGPVLALDLGGRLPGRGAHLHRDLECLELADRRRAFPKALRQREPLDTSVIRRYLEAIDDRRHGMAAPTAPPGEGDTT